MIPQSSVIIIPCKTCELRLFYANRTVKMIRVDVEAARGESHDANSDVKVARDTALLFLQGSVMSDLIGGEMGQNLKASSARLIEALDIAREKTEKLKALEAVLFEEEERRSVADHDLKYCDHKEVTILI